MICYFDYDIYIYTRFKTESLHKYHMNCSLCFSVNSIQAQYPQQQQQQQQQAQLSQQQPQPQPQQQPAQPRYSNGAYHGQSQRPSHGHLPNGNHGQSPQNADSGPWQQILQSGEQIVPQWVQCARCRKWRVLKVSTREIVTWREPPNWTCSMNAHPNNHCDAPQERPDAKQYSPLQLQALTIQRGLKMKRTQQSRNQLLHHHDRYNQHNRYNQGGHRGVGTDGGHYGGRGGYQQPHHCSKN